MANDDDGEHRRRRPTSEALNAARKNLEGVRVLVLDEFSMVTPQLLLDIDVRLRQLLKIDAPFGGLSVI